MVDYDVIVVGAGLGGSITAAYLAQAGLRTVVFDRADVGGRYEGFKRDGLRMDNLLSEEYEEGRTKNCHHSIFSWAHYQYLHAIDGESWLLDTLSEMSFKVNKALRFVISLFVQILHHLTATLLMFFLSKYFLDKIFKVSY